MPTRATRGTSTAGNGQASLANASPPRPSAAASTIPWTFPLGDVCGRLRSPCASIQSTPPGPFARASPPSVPSATEWSPPRTSGNCPRPTHAATSAARRSHVALICGRNRRLGSPSLSASATGAATLPRSKHSWPSERMRCSSPAYRIAEGPMSTPRRPAPRSRLAPMIATAVSPLPRAGTLLTANERDAGEADGAIRVLARGRRLGVRGVPAHPDRAPARAPRRRRGARRARGDRARRRARPGRDRPRPAHAAPRRRLRGRAAARRPPAHLPDRPHRRRRARRSPGRRGGGRRRRDAQDGARRRPPRSALRAAGDRL